MTVTRLGHVGLVVADIDAYASFLVDGLGLSETRRDGRSAYFRPWHPPPPNPAHARYEPVCGGIGLTSATSNRSRGCARPSRTQV